MDKDVQLRPLFEWQKQAHELINQAVKQGKRLIMLNCGRRSGKSDCLAKWAIFWERGILRGGHIAFCAPSEQHYAEVKRWIKTWLADLIIGPSPAGDGYDFLGGGRISFLSLGPGSVAPARGREFQAAIVDEAAHLKDNLIALLEANIMPTLALTGGPVILGSTPKGVGGDYYTLWQRAGREGARFSGPSTINPDFDPREFERNRKALPELVFLQEYCAAFVDFQGAILKRNEIRVGCPPDRDELESVCLGVDFALEAHARADQSAICVAGVNKEKRIWVLHVAAWRANWPETLSKTLNYIEAWRPDLVCMEEVCFQTAVVHQLADCGVSLLPLKTNKSKTERFGIVHCQYVTNRIWHSDRLSDEFTNQLLGFPETKNDDMVDSLTFAVAGLVRGIRLAWGQAGNGAVWSTQLPHEQTKKKLYGLHGKLMWDPEEREKEDEDGITSNN
jgi:predicted phage terminase large subunit-like protein